MPQECKQDQRVFERLNVEFSGLMKQGREDQEQNILARNLSAGGMSVLSTKAFSFDDEISLSFKNPRVSQALDFKGRVAWTNREEPHFWRIGIQFNEINFMRTSRILNIFS